MPPTSSGLVSVRTSTTCCNEFSATRVGSIPRLSDGGYSDLASHRRPQLVKFYAGGAPRPTDLGSRRPWFDPRLPRLHAGQPGERRRSTQDTEEIHTCTPCISINPHFLTQPILLDSDTSFTGSGALGEIRLPLSQAACVGGGLPQAHWLHAQLAGGGSAQVLLVARLLSSSPRAS